MSRDCNIVLTGFMGTGKSTVGKLVAEKLGRPFVDTDEEIVKQAGKAIPEIFAQAGEAVFRHMERRVCRFFAGQSGYVIATGGGMLVDEGNRAVMLTSGLVVCLNGSPEAIQQRLQTDHTERPLLKGDWQSLLEKRRPAYNTIPNQIDTNDRSPAQIAEEIVGLWQKASM